MVPRPAARATLRLYAGELKYETFVLSVARIVLPSISSAKWLGSK